MKYKAILSDLDGTLIHNSKHALPSPKALDAIRKAEEKGIIFSLATARPISFLTYILEHMQCKVIVIFDNGAGIYDSAKKKVLWESTMDGTVVNQLLPLFKTIKHKGISLSMNDGTQPHILETIQPHEKVRRITIIGLPVTEIDTVVKELENKFKNVLVGKASSFEGDGFNDIYITTHEATKQHAILKLAEILHINTHEIIGIGDHYNDFPLFMACGLKVAMGNAVPELKAIADYIAPSVDEDGVVDVIEKFVLH